MLGRLERIGGATPRLWAQVAAGVFLAGLAGANVYRAATQSITADEAFTYSHFAGGDEPVKLYDANHHVLFTWLARASVAAFGLSEFTLRLPAVLAGLFYLASVFLLSRRLSSSPGLFLLSAASLSLNPFVLDFLSAARGYGPALALFFWAFYLLAGDLETGSEAAPARTRLAALCLALAAAANLNFAVPAAALAAVFSLAAAWHRPPFRPRLLRLAGRFLTLGLLPAAAILAWPLRTASRSSFYVGVETLRQTMQGAIFYSFCHAAPQAPSALQNLLWDVSHWFVPTALGLGAAWCAGLIAGAARRGGRRLKGPEILLLLAGGTSLGALALLVLAKHSLGLKYPVDRTALYWIPLFTLVCLGLIGATRGRGLLPGLLGLAPALFLAAACLQYALQFNLRYYAQWRYDAGTKQIVNLIRARQARRPKPRVRVRATWLFEPSLNFYRQRYRPAWLERVTREGPEGDADYYVLVGEDLRLVEGRGLRVLYRDPLSGAVLASPGGVLQSGP